MDIIGNQLEETLTSFKTRVIFCSLSWRVSFRSNLPLVRENWKLYSCMVSFRFVYQYLAAIILFCVFFYISEIFLFFLFYTLFRSATVDSHLFSHYFGNCPVITAQGRTHPVSTYFLEDIYESINYRLASDSPASLSYGTSTREKVFQFTCLDWHFRWTEIWNCLSLLDMLSLAISGFCFGTVLKFSLIPIFTFSWSNFWSKSIISKE